MREIKFRGKVFNIWVYGHYLPWHSVKDENGKDVYAQIFVDDGRHSKQNIVGAHTVGQFTGLRDKNGKEIYDGDIVKVEHNYPIYSDWNGKEKIPHKPRRSYGGEEYERDYDLARCYKYYRNYKVEYNLKNQRLEIRNGSDCHALTGYFIRAHNVEVIGNIYDNPELLKGDKE